MSLSRFAKPAENNCEINGGKGNFFNLLDLSDELITHVFSFLSIEDRMRARLNKRLFTIEAESQYFIQWVKLQSPEAHSIGEKYVHINGKLCEFDHIRRIASNASIGFLEIVLPASDELCRRFCSLVKEFRNIVNLMQLEVNDDSKECLTDPFFLNLSLKCNAFWLDSLLDVSPEALYQVYKNMYEETSSLVKLRLSHFKKEMFISFLNLIGITFKDGRVFSSRNIEAMIYAYKKNFVNRIYIFDGLFEIQFCVNEDEMEFSYLTLELHKNKESIKSETNRYRMKMIEMPLSQFAQPIEINCEVNGGNENYFNLLGLPNEIITLAFSFLPIKDLMRARVNKRLFNVVAESKCYIKRLKIEIKEPYTDDDYKVHINDKLCEFDYIRRIASNASIGELEIKFPESDEHYRIFCNLIKEFRNIAYLSILFDDGKRENKEKECLSDPSFFELLLARNCEEIWLVSFYITPAALLELYKSMCDHPSSLREFNLTCMKYDVIMSFLNQLGITFRGNRVFSTRHIEFFKYDDGNGYVSYEYIFDGLNEIYYRKEDDITTHLALIPHEDQESVENAKNRYGMERVEVIRQ